MKPKQPPKGGYEHIVLPPPESVPFETYDDLPEPDWDGDPEPGLEYGEDYGTCDAPGCMVMYAPSNGTDHCGEEGMCWAHCSDVKGHAPKFIIEDAIKELTDVAESVGVEVPEFASPYMPNNPMLIGDALISKVGPPPSELIKYVSNAINNNAPQDVYEYSQGLLDQALGAATPADRIALFVSGIEAIARGEHAQVVAFSEGRSLAKHMADYGGNECGVCENLRKYSENALDLLKPIAVQQMQEQEEAKQELEYVSLGVCVDCGKPSVRRYSLEEGKGYMCARCAGPYLLMDDGAPGDPWPEQEKEG